MGNRRHRWRAALATLPAAGLIVTALSVGGVSAGTPGPAAAEPSAFGDGVVPTAVVDRYLAHRPALGPVTVVDVGAEPPNRRLLAATLQGIVNRSSARIYLRGADGMGGAVDQYWLDHYVDEGLVTVSTTTGLDGALTAFAGEVGGYVVADAAEPWTINAATSIAGVLGGVVATPDQVAALAGLGLAELDDTRGRWPDAATAYEAVAAAYRDQFDYQGISLISPGQHASRDFNVQQGMLTAYTRPSQPDFDRVYALFDLFGVEHPVYGYVSNDGGEEIVAVGRLAAMGRFLVATDTTDNISFHVAVGAARPRASAHRPTPRTEPCTTDELNVVLSISDGDNIRIAESTYRTGDRWNSPQRGVLPLGWSIGPPTAILLPSIWDHYATTDTANDQLVGIMGLGYTFSSLLPDPTAYLQDSFVLSGALGLDSYWSLDVLLRVPDAAGWPPLLTAAASAGATPDGVLVNYLNFGGPPWFHTPDGTPAMNSQSRFYEDGTPELLEQIDALLAAPSSERPLVAFFSVTAWNNTVDGLVAALAPLEAEGVRFLTPSEAFACLPDPPVEPTTSTTSPTLAPSPPAARGIVPAFTG